MKPMLILLAATTCLTAQERTTVYGRVAVAYPMQHLGTAVDRKLGAGVALGVDLPLEDGWRWRVDGGFTKFFLGADQAAVNATGDVTHLSVEALYQLRDAPGPYLFAGLGAYSWSVPIENTSGVATQQRRGRVGGTLGLGWRHDARWFGELRATGGTVDPGFTALWLTASVGMHF
jgi:hypothetical protein